MAPRRRGLSAILVALTLLTGCAVSDLTGRGAPQGTTQPSIGRPTAVPTEAPVALPVKLRVEPEHGVKAALPNDTLAIQAVNGTVKKVVVSSGKKKVAGTFDGTTWTPKRYFGLNTRYTVTVTVADTLGALHKKKATFRTLKPKAEAGYAILYTGYEVGVGMPATIQFVSGVTTAKQRAEVERHVKVTSVPAQAGSWGWLDNRQLMWRPKKFWKPGTKVTITANLRGIKTGPGKYIASDATGKFTVGAARISYVSITGHSIRVTKNGRTVRTMPVTNGKPGFTTRSGTKVIIERYSSIIMDSDTVDIPRGSSDQYRLNVKYAMRTTWTGEFLHAAPWSVGSQGHANVSHGCTGMSMSNAAWLFNFSRAGDVVKYSGSGRRFQPTEGIGVWQFSYQQWKKQSALA